jgi:hypothetical protein
MASRKFTALDWKTLTTHVGVGMATASFWRGAWYMLDDSLFPEDATASAAASLGLGIVGMAGSQGLIAKTELVRNPIWRKAARFGALYTVAASCVLIWRGTWLGWDLVYEHAHHCPVQQTGPKATDTKHALYSGAASHVSAIIALLGCGMFCSVLAPPAAACILRDASVKSASRYYTGPAQQVVNRLWGGPLATSRQYYSQTTHRSKRHISPLNDRVLAHARSSTTTLRNNNTNRSMWTYM